MLKRGVQDELNAIGAFACYALTLCRIAELSGGPSFDIGAAVSNIDRGISAGYLDREMTVLDGAAFLRQLTLMKWAKEYKPAGYNPRPGDYLIAEWFNKRTGKTHFTLEYPEKWNSLENSVTVKEGAIRSYRLYRTTDG
jgi:hypothetical protein